MDIEGLLRERVEFKKIAKTVFDAVANGHFWAKRTALDLDGLNVFDFRAFAG